MQVDPAAIYANGAMSLVFIAGCQLFQRFPGISVLKHMAINLSSEDWSYRHVWVFLPWFYFLGLVFAWRRYR